MNRYNLWVAILAGVFLSAFAWCSASFAASGYSVSNLQQIQTFLNSNSSNLNSSQQGLLSSINTAVSDASSNGGQVTTADQQAIQSSLNTAGVNFSDLATSLNAPAATQSAAQALDSSQASGADTSGSSSQNWLQSAYNNMSSTLQHPIQAATDYAMQSVSNFIVETANQLLKSCWSCDMYGATFIGLSQVVTKTFADFVQNKPTMIALGITICGIVMIWRLLKIIGTPVMPGDQELAFEWGEFIRYCMRVAVVFIGLLSTATVASMSSSSSTSSGSTGSSSTVNPVKDFFVDGPLSLGTAIGVEIIQSAQSVTNITVSQMTSCGSNVSGISGSATTLSSLGQQHLGWACGILMGMHSQGVVGVALGAWLATQGIGLFVNNNVITAVAAIACGLVMAFAFLSFTVTFGLRYLDALIRAMLSLSLMPLFFFLWIFRSTRPIAHAALRSVLFMGAVFTASGLVFIFANMIMAYGYQKALNTGSGGSFNPQAIISAMGNNGNGYLIQKNANSSSVNFVSYFYLMGSWALASALARSVFDIAAELVEFRGGELGVGAETGREISSYISGAPGMAASGAKSVLGVFGR